MNAVFGGLLMHAWDTGNVWHDEIQIGGGIPATIYYLGCLPEYTYV